MRFARLIIIATAVTGILALGLKFGIERVIRHRHPGIEKAEVEQLFNHLELIAAGLAAVGVLILWSGLRARMRPAREDITNRDSLAIGAIQGLCLPFRGFSRSGATISLGLLLGVAKTRVEEFSFALAVVLTPAVVAWEARRLIRHHGEAAGAPIGLHDFLPSLVGMVFSFLAGLVGAAVALAAARTRQVVGLRSLLPRRRGRRLRAVSAGTVEFRKGITVAPRLPTDNRQCGLTPSASSARPCPTT